MVTNFLKIYPFSTLPSAKLQKHPAISKELPAILQKSRFVFRPRLSYDELTQGIQRVVHGLKRLRVLSPFEEVLEQYEPMISSIIRKLNIYREFEQFRQAGRIALWQAWSRYDETQGDFAPFAYRSIYGALLDELKRETRFSDVHVPAEDDLLEYAGSVTDSDTSAFSRLEALLLNLTAAEKELLILLYEDRVSQTACAAHFGISVAGVKKRRERLLAKLRGQLSG